MTPELEKMMEEERDTLLLYDGSLRALNPDMRDDYLRREWLDVLMDGAKVALVLGVPTALVFLLGAFK